MVAMGEVDFDTESMAPRGVPGGYGESVIQPAATIPVSDTVTISSLHEPLSTKTTESSSSATASTKISSTTASSATTIATTFDFVELHDGIHLYSLQEDHFLAADFESICPSGNCQTECRNLTRVFTASAADLGGSSDGDRNDIPVTLFGICSNLANATNSASLSGDSKVQSFFPDTLTELSTGAELISANLTTCLATTCDMTRKPYECADYCRPEKLLQSPTLLDLRHGIYGCTQKLCSNTCGLPYADQDVFGVGVGHPFFFPGIVVPPRLSRTHLPQVLISYYIQAILLFLLAAAALASAGVQIFRLGRKPTVSVDKEPVKNVLGSFLATQCYFGGR